MRLRAAAVASLSALLVAQGLATSVAAEPTRESSFQLYKSLDHGRSWSRVGTGLPESKRINALAIAGGVSFAGTDAGIFVSSDGGRSWSTSVITPPSRVQCLAVEGRAVYAGTSDAGVFVTVDDGGSWRRIERGLTDLNVRSLATNGRAVYAGTDSRGVFMHAGGDEGWLPFGRDLPEPSQVFDLGIKGNKVYAALYSKGLYRVDAASARWQRVGDVRPLELLIRGAALVAGHNPGGILQSVNGGASWTEADGIPGGPPIWVLGDAGPNILAGLSPGTVVSSGDRGKTWRPSAAGLPQDSAVIAIGDSAKATLAAIVLPRREISPEAAPE